MKDTRVQGTIPPMMVERSEHKRAAHRETKQTLTHNTHTSRKWRLGGAL